ncbi:MAG: hypothetical protein J6Q65_02150, partial [Lentisphaeria bacterium]|nr:hypothetical protein [Lentisphaeria bacterium]
DKWIEDSNEYLRLQGEATKAQKEAEKSANDLADAEALLADELAATEEITGETLQTVQQVSSANKDAADSANEWSKEEKAAGKAAVEAADSAIKALADYVQGVRDSTAQAVNSVLKGFEQVGKAGDDLRKKNSELAGEETEALNNYSDVWAKWGSDDSALRAMKKYQDETGKLTERELEAYEALVKVRNAQNETNEALDQYKPEGMKAGLQSQIDFMNEYLENLEKAQKMGLSDELLASLSDGSKESAEYLAGLVNGGEEAAKEVRELYDTLSEKKKGFVDTLSQQKLAADETFDALVEKAIEAIGELNLGAQAEEAMSNTVGGLAQGIADKIPEVQSAVDSIEEQINRLSNFGFSFDIGGSAIDFNFSKLLDGEFETGLDRVPFDGFLASLHEGEGILTAEENRIWQRFKNGNASGVDYDTLGGVMRDNVHAGGNVYLDGRTVGHVISDAQGRSYRNLQRSGWQG